MSTPVSLQQCLALHQRQQWQQAAEAYTAFLKADPEHTVALVNLGAVYRQMNAIDDARRCYEKATQIDSTFVEGWFNFGNLCFSIRDWQQAQVCYQQALVQQPNNTQILYQLAAVAREQKNWKQCRDALLKLLLLDPGHISALLELGNAWRHLGDKLQSRDCYLTLVNAEPTAWKGHYSLARWYDGEGDAELFSQHRDLALKHAPSAWLVHHNLAQARFDVGAYEAAMQSFEAALANRPNDSATLIALGACAERLGHTGKAKACFQSVSQSDDVVVLSQLARVIWEYKYFEEAVVILQKIVALQPELPDGHLNVAKAHYQSWRMSDAKASLDKALALRPDYPEAEDLLVDLFLREGKPDYCLPVYRQRIERDGPLCPSVSSYLFAELYSSTVSAEEKYTHHRTLMDRWVEQLCEPATFSNTKDSRRPLKIGLVSADFRDQHPVGIFIQPLLNFMDRSRFSLVAYHNSQTHDDSTRKIKERMDQWWDVAGWSDERLRAKIIEDEIDILVDLSGQTAKNRLRLFAMRAAPVQVTWMGYPHSTGLSTMDYMIADPVVCPPEQAHLCSETVKVLPHHSVFCYLPTDDYGEPDMTRVQQRQEVVFGSFNNLLKVNAETLALWRDVLFAVPGSKLKLKTPSFTDENCRQYFLDYFTGSGIEESRLIFSGPSSLHDMMREYNEMDIALDTFPYNGGTTTFQALWMAVPVLTMAGTNFCGRMGASAMTRLGMQDWVAHSREDFIDRAVTLAADRETLLKTKKGLREKMLQSPLCDAQGFGVEMGRVFEEIWAAYCEKP